MMNKSIRKSNLAKVVLASLFAMNIYGTAFAAPSGGFWGDDVDGREPPDFPVRRAQFLELP